MTARKMLDALTGPNYGLRATYLMARATYAYTRSWDGVDGMRFGRWYAFTCAVRCGSWYLFPMQSK